MTADEFAALCVKPETTLRQALAALEDRKSVV